MPIRRRNAAALAIALFVLFAIIFSGNIALTQPEVDPFAESLEQAQSLADDYPLLLNPPEDFDCPCTRGEAARSDLWVRDTWYLAKFHPGALDAYRSVDTWESTPGGPQHGQQCTYNGTKSNSQLITGGAAAGTPDIVSPGADRTDHWALDVVPFERLGWRIYGQYWRPNNGNNCLAPVYITPIELSPGNTDIVQLPNARVGVLYTQRLNASGGRGHAFELTGAFLAAFEPDDTVMPYGLNLRKVGSAWQLRGKPTSAAANQTFTFTIRATAANGRTGMQVYRIYVEPAVPEVPNLIGTWTGDLYQGTGPNPFRFDFSITISNQNGNAVSGTSRISTPGTPSYAVMSFTGAIIGNTVILTENRVIEGTNPAAWCIKHMQLGLNGNNLAGSWSAQFCVPGTLSVSR